jgi:hypothetical protein
MATKTTKKTRTSPVSKTATRKTTTKSNRSQKPENKTDLVIRMLRRREGASLPEIVEATGWLEHSCRALLSATISKKHGLPLVKSKRSGQPTRYHIAALR